MSSFSPSESQPETSHNRFSFSQRAQWASGAAIGKLMAQALAHPDLLSLAAGFVDNASLPCEAVDSAFKRMSSTPERMRAALQYDASAGNRELREMIADLDKSKANVDNLVLTAGSNQMLHLLAETILDPGDIVLCAAPTYFVFLGTLRGVGARAVRVEADADGMCMEDLQKQLQLLRQKGLASKVKAIYCVTEFDNPAGSTLNLQRREQLLELVARWRTENQSQLLVLSDNAYRELRFSGERLPQLTEIDSHTDYVIELGTFSKSFSPGVRVGWGVLPESMISRTLEMKSNIDFGSPHFSQMLMLEVLKGGEWQQHVPQILEVYRSKRDAMLNALELHFKDAEGVHWRVPEGGLYIWLTLPEHIDTSEESELWEESLRQGVLYVPGHHCFPTYDGEGLYQPPPKNTIRLSFGVQDLAGIEQGIQKLAAALASCLATVGG